MDLDTEPGGASGRQGEADGGAAGGWIVAGVDRASVRPNQVPHDGQPQTATPGVTRPCEPFEHLVKLALATLSLLPIALVYIFFSRWFTRSTTSGLK
jgi:hypothetical protein